MVKSSEQGAIRSTFYEWDWPWNWPAGSKQPGPYTPSPLHLYWCGVYPTSNAPTKNVNGDPLVPGAFYFNTDLNKPLVWNGRAWVSFVVSSVAHANTLIYQPGVFQADFDLSQLDVNGNTYRLAPPPNPAERVLVYMNGVRLIEDLSLGTGFGDFTVDHVNNLVSLTTGAAQPTDIIQIDILLPNDAVKAGNVDAVKILDFDTDWSVPEHPPGVVDGERVQFSIYVANYAGDPYLAVLYTEEELAVFVDGVHQEPGVAYTVSGTNLIMDEAPRVDSEFWAVWYRPQSTSTSTGAPGSVSQAQFVDAAGDLPDTTIQPIANGALFVIRNGPLPYQMVVWEDTTPPNIYGTNYDGDVTNQVQLDAWIAAVPRNDGDYAVHKGTEPLVIAVGVPLQIGDAVIYYGGEFLAGQFSSPQMPPAIEAAREGSWHNVSTPGGPY